MALDAATLALVANEQNSTLLDAKIDKIFEPTRDEVLMTLRTRTQTFKLLLSARSGSARVCLTKESFENPLTPPGFCMLLRKHITGGKILSITHPGLERIQHFHFEHHNEMGDVCVKILIVELMGKHSNIIFCQPDMTIIDSIKHISANVSSISEVLPGRQYFIAETQHKLHPLEVDETSFIGKGLAQPLPVG